MGHLDQTVSASPRLVFWELTTGCNLRCVHCRASQRELLNPDDLSYTDSCELIDQLAEYAPLDLVFSGGEPLWRRDVFALAARARSKNLQVSLASNGTLVDEAMAERVRDAGIVRVAVGLDGAEAFTHDYFRGHVGAFDAAIRGLRCLNQVGVSTQINTTVTRHNLHQLSRVVRLAEELEVAAVHLYLLAPLGCGLLVAEEEALQGDEAEEIIAWLCRKAPETQLELEVTCAPRHYHVARLQSSRSAGIPLAPVLFHGIHSLREGCRAGDGICLISHQGEVYPCGYLPVSAGNVREEPFREIWEHAAVLDRMRSADESEQECGACEYQRVCAGRTECEASVEQ